MAELEYTKIQLRTDSQSEWNRVNPILAKGEIGIVSDLNKFKIGDGQTSFILLPFANQSADELDKEFAKINAQINEIKGAGYVTSTEVESAITAKNYVPKEGFATINGNDITNGGDIKIEGGGVTMEEVETKIAENVNGYQNSEQVESAITAKGYTTSSDVEQTITSKGYVNTNQVDSIVTNKGYTTTQAVENIIINKNYVPKTSFATINGADITNGGDVAIEGGFENVDVVLTKDPDSWVDEAILNVEPNKVYKLTTDETLIDYSFDLKLKHNGSFEGVSYILWDNTNGDIDISYVSGASSYGETPYFNIIGSVSDETQHYVEVVGVNGNAIANVDVHTTSLPQFKTINGVEIKGFGNISGLREENVDVNTDNSSDNRLVIGLNNNGSNYIYNIKGTPNADGKLYLQVYSSGKGFYLIKWNDTQLKIKDIDVTYGNQNKAIHRKGSVKDNTIDPQGFQCHYAYVFPYEESIFFTDGLYEGGSGGGVTMEQVEAKGYQTSADVESAITTKNYTTLDEVNQQGFAKTSEIPTDNKDLTNGAGYTTSADVESAITAKGYTTKQTIEENANTDVVLDMVENKIYNLTAPQLTSLKINTIPNSVLESVVYFNSGETPTTISVVPALTIVGDIDNLEKNKKYILAVKDNYLAIAVEGTISIGGDVKWEDILNKPTFADVATSGSYNDLKDKPTIPSDNATLTNGAGYQTSSDVDSAIVAKGYVTNAQVEQTITTKDYATNTKVTEVENLANSKVTMAEVEAKDYSTKSQLMGVEDKIPNNTEHWVFTMADGTTQTKEVFINTPTPTV